MQTSYLADNIEIAGFGLLGSFISSKIRAIVYEKRKNIWEKPCSGIVSKRIKEFKIPWKEVIIRKLKSVTLATSKISFEIKRGAYLLDRLKLQKLIAKEAYKRSKIFFGKKWRKEMYSKDKIVIGCDGALSDVAKFLGIKRKYIQTYQVTCKFKSNFKFSSDVIMLFGGFSKFFGWIYLYKENFYRIGVMSYKNAKKAFTEMIKNFGIKIYKIRKIESWPIPIFDGKKVVYGNIALVGDAAAQTKATTGGGIIFGLLCAKLLIKAIKKGNLSLYQKYYQREIKPLLFKHLILRKILDRINYDKLFKAIIEENFQEVIEKYGDMEKIGIFSKVLKKPKMLIKILASLKT